MTVLGVWMDGQQVATLSERRSTLRLEHTEAAFAAGIGRPLLSVSLPVRNRPYQGGTAHAFFNGLLPEGEARRMIAHDFGVHVDSVIDLLAILGRDCAGALVVLADGEAPEEPGPPEPVSEAEVAERLRQLRISPLGVDNRVRVSLAGIQEKLLLAKTGEGWALPVDGAPSTHILKPVVPLLRHSVTNEAFCMRVAHHLDIPVAQVELGSFEDRRVLVVERYDRARGFGGVARIHQEDLCQATGREPTRKYEEQAGPSLVQCTQVLRSWARDAENIERLLDVTVLNVAIGNADAHAKNLSLLHLPNGRISLAPAYDLMSTTYYADTSTKPGMLVNGVDDITAVTVDDLVAEADSWGLGHEMVTIRVHALLDRLPAAVEAAALEIEPPESLVDHIRANAGRLRR